ncbi:MAG: deoxyribonuclease IV [Planctomycetota bacterium]|jgi:deoxyribonuclease-4
MFGAHLSVAGGLVNALDEARRLRMDCVQVFTKNQRQWRVPPLRDEDREAWLARLRALRWHRLRGPVRVVSHASYLVNLASPDATVRRRSIAMQREEIERCETLRIRCCVVHPGAHLGPPRRPGEPNDLDGPFRPGERAGLRRIVTALDRVHRDLPGYRTLTCLETTVGAGTNLGYDFRHLAFIREHVREPERIAFCLDTCHVTAAGYDLTTDAAARAVMRRWNEVCGLRHLRVVHMNDSIGAVGSRRDRHAHIGDGACGRACMRMVVNLPALRSVPKILETPKGTDERGREWDQVNIRRLKRLIRRPGSSR